MSETILSTFDHLFDAVLVVNNQKKIVYFNHQATIFFKLPPRLFKQKDNILGIVEAAPFDLEDWISKALLSFDVLVSPEITLSLIHEPDTDYHVVLKLIPITDTTGKMQFALVFHDISVEKNLHDKYRLQLEELKKTHAQILQADKLTTLGEMTANISHEINNPLTIASGNIEIIDAYLSMPKPLEQIEQIQSSTKTVVESLGRINQIIKNMKDFLYQSEDQKEYCDLESLIDTAKEWINPSLTKRKIEVVKSIKVHRPVVLANRIKIEQVLINILKNSIDALETKAKGEGKIFIEVDQTEGHRLLIHIKDNGPGIPEESFPELFKPFYTTKEVGKGTGLGLSICSQIIEAHKGKIECLPSSTGAHFVIRLPSIELYSYTKNNKAFRHTSAQESKKILVVDNEVQILNIMNTFLEDSGHVFIGSHDPIRALEFLQKADVDLIITDYSMPNLNGSEFAEKAREAGHTGHILYMTSLKYAEQYQKDKINYQISGMILKPFNKDDVLKTVNLALKSGSNL